MPSAPLRLAFAGGLLSALLAATAQAAPPRVAILPAITVDASSRAELEAEARDLVVKTVAAQGAEPLLLDHLSDAQLACRAPDCLRDLVSEVHASHVLRLQADYGGEAYKLRAELWNVETGKLIESRERDCEVCTVRDLHKALQDSTEVLCARLTSSAGGPDVAEGALLPAPAASRAAGPRRGSWGLTVAGLVLAGAGAGAVGTGIYYLALDGRRSCANPDPLTPCDRSFKAPVNGWLLVGGGAALTTLVAGLLTWHWTWASVAASPGGVQVAGTF